MAFELIDGKPVRIVKEELGDAEVEQIRADLQSAVDQTTEAFTNAQASADEANQALTDAQAAQAAAVSEQENFNQVVPFHEEAPAEVPAEEATEPVAEEVNEDGTEDVPVVF